MTRARSQPQPDPSGAPFEEHEAVRAARGEAEKLARTKLPILIAGEAGSGKRTLAHRLAGIRQQSLGSREPLHMRPDLGLGEQLRIERALPRPESPLVLVAEGLEAFSERDLKALAVLIDDQLIAPILIATSSAPPGSLVATLPPELAAHVVMATWLPPLRDRTGDAVRWARHFLEEATARAGTDGHELTTAAENVIQAHGWPGNLTELRSRIDRSVALGAARIGPSELGLEEVETDVLPLANALENFKTQYVERVLARCDGNRSQAARLLKIDVRTIFRLLEKARSRE